MSLIEAQVRLTAHGHNVDIGWDDDEDHISRRIIETKDFYERGILDDCYERAGPGLVVDAGAHIGNHTLWFAGIMERDVVAFEPRLASYDQLVSNIRVNGLWGRVVAHRAALGEKAGTCAVEEPRQGNTGASQVVYGTGDVEVMALDDLDLHPAVVKIDVESSVLAVLAGAARTLARHRPLLYVETGEDQDAIDAMLVGIGYFHQGWLGATPTHIYESGA